jgi:hypothetical protein
VPVADVEWAGRLRGAEIRWQIVFGGSHVIADLGRIHVGMVSDLPARGTPQRRLLVAHRFAMLTVRHGFGAAATLCAGPGSR